MGVSVSRMKCVANNAALCQEKPLYSASVGAAGRGDYRIGGVQAQLVQSAYINKK